MSMRLEHALARLPDEPRWVDVRGMLLSGRARVQAAPDASPGRHGFIVTVPDVSLAAIVGEPPPELIAATVTGLIGDVNLLAQHEDAGSVRAALPGWIRHTAILHVLPEVVPWESEPDPATRVFGRGSAPRLDHVPEPLRRELREALAGRTTARFVEGAFPRTVPAAASVDVPMAAAWAGSVPVAFCYPVWQTERWWDVSIDTLYTHRRQGFAQRAARALIRHLRLAGRAPVWGALDTNTASRALAARLGFIEAGGIAVFTRAADA
jgi:RimJ/RimL family protein N-acetyltransferase